MTTIACPHCQYALPIPMEDEQQPEEGDTAVCGGCATVLYFSSGGARVASHQDLDLLPRPQLLLLAVGKAMVLAQIRERARRRALLN